MKKLFALLPVALIALPLFLAAPASAADAVPTPSPTLPADIRSNLGGIDQTWTQVDGTDMNYTPGDTDYSTPEKRPYALQYHFSINNTYWTSLKLVTATATATTSSLPAAFSIGDGNQASVNEASAAKLNLTRHLAPDADLPVVATGDTSAVLSKGDTASVDLSIPFPQANATYTNGSNDLAAFGFEGETSLYFQGVSTDGRTFILKDTITINDVSPAFANIRTGQEIGCPTDSPCADATAYTLSGQSQQLDFAPLEAVTDPTPPVTPVTPVTPVVPVTPTAPPVTTEPTVPATPTPVATSTSAPAVVVPTTPTATPVAAAPTNTDQLAFTGSSKYTLPVSIGALALIILGVFALIWSRKQQKENQEGLS